MNWRLCMLAAGMLASSATLAESFRCGQWIVSEDNTVAELLEKCGPPTSQDVEYVDVYGPGASGAGRIKRGTVKIEKWIYDRGSQAFRMVVTIEDGRIRSMERQR